MAEVVGLASSVLALSTFTIQSTKTLFEVVQSFRNKTRTVRELKEELEALVQVLQSLQNLQDDPQIDLSALKLPLFRCGQACQGFAEYIKKCTTRSNQDVTSFRDWVMLSYRGKDISGFRNLIGAYKSTIAIALADANIRHVNVTVQLLRQYKEMIENTSADLQDILQQSDQGRGLNAQEEDSVAVIDPAGSNQAAIEEERISIEYCLGVCAQVLNHIEQVQAQLLTQAGIPRSDGEVAENSRHLNSAHSITIDKLEDCKTGIGLTESGLRLQLQDINHRLTRLLLRSNNLEEDGGDESFSRATVEELKSIKQCLFICEHATDEVTKERTNVFEDVHMLDDGHQVIVSTLGDLISAKRISTGARSKQWLGQMSDNSLQQLSKDNTTTVAAGAESGTEMKDSPPKGDRVPDTTDRKRITIQPPFQDRHGAGHPLGT